MTTAKLRTIAKPPTIAKPTPHAPPFRLPDPPERQPDEKMTSFDQLSITGMAHYLARHLGHPETTIVGADRYIVPAPTGDMTGARYPDLLVAFEAAPEPYRRSNGYIISEQGKPPDFVLEIASPSTRRIDETTKRRDYAALGILEYWRFNQAGRNRADRLAGDRLVNDAYEPVPIDDLAEDVLQGRSAALNLDLRWEQGQLGLYIPATGAHITTVVSERAARIRERDRADRERDRADREQAARIRERARANHAEARADRAEARIRQLEAQLRNQPNP